MNQVNIQLQETFDFDEIAPLMEEIQNLHARLYPDIFKPFVYEAIRDAMNKIVADDLCSLYVARLDQRVVGYMVLMVKAIPETAFYKPHQIVHIDQLGVLQSFQQKGIGAALLRKAEQEAQRLGINRLELDHLYLNNPAAKFFRQNGYEDYRSKLCKAL